MKTKNAQKDWKLAAAKAAGGAAALAGAAIFSQPWYPRGEIALADGWGMVAGFALLINAIATAAHLKANRSADGGAALHPLVDSLLPLIVTCGLTVALTTKITGGFDFLYGVWLAGCGLMNLSMRRSVPSAIRIAGLYYIACSVATLAVRTPFMDPWPFALTVFAGEIATAAALAALPARIKTEAAA